MPPASIPQTPEFSGCGRIAQTSRLQCYPVVETGDCRRLGDQAPMSLSSSERIDRLSNFGQFGGKPIT